MNGGMSKWRHGRSKIGRRSWLINQAASLCLMCSFSWLVCTCQHWRWLLLCSSFPPWKFPNPNSALFVCLCSESRRSSAEASASESERVRGTTLSQAQASLGREGDLKQSLNKARQSVSGSTKTR